MKNLTLKMKMICPEQFSVVFLIIIIFMDFLEFPFEVYEMKWEETGKILYN